MRAMIVCPHQVANFDKALGKVYRQAELFGIAACFDGWTNIRILTGIRPR